MRTTGGARLAFGHGSGGNRIPAFIHLADDGRNARIAPVMPARRQILLAPALVVFVAAEQALFRRFHATGARRDAHRLTDADDHRIFHRHHVLDRHHVAGRHHRHAMIGHHDHIHLVQHALARQRIDQAADGSIGLAHGLARLRCIRPVIVARTIHHFQVQRGESRPGAGRFLQPARHVLGALRGGYRFVVWLPTCRAHAVDLRRAAGPSPDRGAHTGFFRAYPDRFRLPPSTITDRGQIRHAEIAQPFIAHRVVDHAMTVGSQPGDQGEMVGEGQRRIGRNHPFGTHSLPGQAIKVRGVALAQIVGPQGIDGNQQQRCGL